MGLWRRAAWPQCDYLLHEPAGILFAPIPKVACSSLKHWLRAVAGISESEAAPSVHHLCKARFGLGRLGRGEAARALQGGQVFRFAFVRNPFDRLVSAFLNKFTRQRLPAARLLRRLRWRRWWSQGGVRAALSGSRGSWLREEFTFRKFVAYLGSEPPLRMDTHWRPQHLFLADESWDFIGRFERLGEDFQTLCVRLGLPAELPHRNATTYRSEATGDCADRPLGAFEPGVGYPWRHFYTPDLVAQVAEIYRQDLVRFQYSLPDLEPPAPLRQAA